MKVTDLRIGNLVFEKDQKERVVTAIMLSEMISCDIAGIEYRYEPIKLINKFLVENADNYTFYHDGCVIFKFGVIKVWQQGESIWVDSPVRLDYIEYLHQFQNLFFALNQTELKINL